MHPRNAQLLAQQFWGKGLLLLLPREVGAELMHRKWGEPSPLCRPTLLCPVFLFPTLCFTDTTKSSL